MIYGPYEAVKQWSATRFSVLDDHVKWVLENDPGWGMHSEKFIYWKILPAIRNAGFRVAEHETMCFYRARPNGNVWINDCSGRAKVASKEIYKHLNPNRQQAVEEVLGRKCGHIKPISNLFEALDC